MKQVEVYKNGDCFVVTNGRKYLALDSDVLDSIGYTNPSEFSQTYEFVDRLHPYTVGEVVSNDPIGIEVGSIIIDSDGVPFKKNGCRWGHMESSRNYIPTFPATIVRVGKTNTN